jgi:hypothetical protein
MSDTQYKIGDKLIYKTVDMEYYSRGYGLSYETKTSNIVDVCYRMENGDLISAKHLEPPVQAEKELKKETQK